MKYTVGSLFLPKTLYRNVSEYEFQPYLYRGSIPMAWRNFNKYRNTKTEVDGIVFDSKKEAARYNELKRLESMGEIKDLKRQVRYELLPEQREPDSIGKRGAVKNGKIIERECVYFADFVYTRTEDGKTVVEDTKGMRTKDYILKRKMMLYFYGIRITEI